VAIPSFNESTTVEFLDVKTMEAYEIPIEDFLPSITVCDDFNEAVFDMSQEHCNDAEHWKVIFRGHNSDGTTDDHLAIDCLELVDSWTDMSEEERTSLKAEFLIKGQLCPNITSMTIKGSILSGTRFVARIIAT